MNNNNNVQGGGQQDYLDKAFNAGAKKFGGAQGQKIANNRGMSEKIVSFAPLLILRDSCRIRYARYPHKSMRLVTCILS